MLASTRRRYRLAVAVALAVASSLAIASSAAAATFTVTNNADSGAGSLRQAITSAEANGIADTIAFDTPLIGGNTITAATQLPGISEPLQIVGCTSSPTTPGPCVELRGASAAISLLLFNEDASPSRVTGIAFTRANEAILDLSDGLVVARDYFGLDLSGSGDADDHLTAGIRTLNENTVIGGPTTLSRNVFGNVTFGVRTGANGTTIQGNYFGTDATGTAAEPVGTAIQGLAGILETLDDVTIGGDNPAPGTCSTPCNVIASAVALAGDPSGTGIELPNARDAVIAGNFIGLGADGASMPNEVGVLLPGDSEGVRVGGDLLIAAGNTMLSSEISVDAGSGAGRARALEVSNNRIGFDPLDDPAPAHTLPDASGIVVDAAADDQDEPSTIASNRISVAGEAAVRVSGEGAELSVNQIGFATDSQHAPGGVTGIHLDHVSDADLFNNLVGTTQESGILIEGGGINFLRSNNIGVSGDGPLPNSGAGISIVGSSNNLIGINPVTPNTISHSDGDAIEVTHGALEATGNVLGPFLTGTDNGGLMIDLGADGPGNAPTGPHGGVQPPTIASATTTGASGTSVPNFTVNTYEKTTAAPGELGARLAGVDAAPDGAWSLTYPVPRAEGAPVGAIQNPPSGSSEVAIALTATPQAPPPPPPGAGTPGPSAEDPRCSQLRKKLKKAKTKAKKRKLRRKLRRLGC